MALTDSLGTGPKWFNDRKANMYRVSLHSRASCIAGVAMLISLIVPLPGHASTWDEAQTAFRAQEDARALELLEKAAEEGDLRALQPWTLILVRGEKLFAAFPKKSDDQVRDWFRKLGARCKQTDRTAPEIAWVCRKVGPLAAE